MVRVEKDTKLAAIKSGSVLLLSINFRIKQTFDMFKLKY